MFCPFINDTCNEKCMYRGHNIELPDDCYLYDAVQTLRSLQAPDNQIDKRLQAIESELSSINCNTSSDQTDSYRILGEVEEIKGLLNQIIDTE